MREHGTTLARRIAERFRGLVEQYKRYSMCDKCASFYKVASYCQPTSGRWLKCEEHRTLQDKPLRVGDGVPNYLSYWKWCEIER